MSLDPGTKNLSERPSNLLLERTLSLAPVSLLLLFGPAWIAVMQANAFADRFYDPLGSALEPLLHWLHTLPAPLTAILAGDYGVVAMLPFLLLYALPTVLVFTVLIGIYKSTGLIDRLSFGLHPWLRPFGLGGRDLVRVIMGFGCNVPAVIAHPRHTQLLTMHLCVSDFIWLCVFLSTSGNFGGFRCLWVSMVGPDLPRSARDHHLDLFTADDSSSSSAGSKQTKGSRFRKLALAKVEDRLL